MITNMIMKEEVTGWLYMWSANKWRDPQSGLARHGVATKLRGAVGVLLLEAP